MGIVTDAPPELTPDLYPGQHATKIDALQDNSDRVNIADFKRTYVLRGNSTGVVVNATKLEGPLWIYFDVDPLYDCIADPDACRGGKYDSASNTVLTSIITPYFTLTVRENSTREIVAEDGYGGIYSSQTTNRVIKIYGEGWYHLTLSGNSVDVTFAIATGTATSGPELIIPAAPAPSEISSSSSRNTGVPPMILRQMQQGR